MILKNLGKFILSLVVACAVSFPTAIYFDGLGGGIQEFTFIIFAIMMGVVFGVMLKLLKI
ncbi:MAG: hypothetical protein WCT49_06620 [Candidatus Paceibacterota bacterium]|jgi:hypothetical protein|nr:hypothetical protein [Candidatus Paceibacterota bacterium]